MNKWCNENFLGHSEVSLCPSQHQYRSEPYRTIKLFLVGKTDGGKSTLLRRLTSQNDKMPGKTVGIDIEEFNYPPKRKGKIEPVQFIVWDFAGEVCMCITTVAGNLHMTTTNSIHVILGTQNHSKNSVLLHTMNLITSLLYHTCFLSPNFQCRTSTTPLTTAFTPSALSMSLSTT